MELGKRVGLIYIFNRNGEVLMYKRDESPKRIPEPGAWSIFGGVIDDRETPLGGMKRELKEELKIMNGRVSHVKYIGKMVKKSTNQKLYFFEGRTDASLTEISGESELKGRPIEYIPVEEIKRNVRKFEPSIRKFFLKNFP
ncbi:MAG: NUDIX domain-containing protein [Nanoarchaeota archaeon]|nr:NUDIX domain-containing protein [Nanoarchaeota archaeon]